VFIRFQSDENLSGYIPSIKDFCHRASLISDNRANQIFNITAEDDGVVVVSGELPLIPVDDTPFFLWISNEPMRSLAAIICESGDVLEKYARAERTSLFADIIFGSPILNVYISEYITAKSRRGLIAANDVESAIEDLKILGRDSKKEFSGIITESRGELETMVKDLQDRVYSSSAIQAAKDQEWHTFLLKSREEIEAARALAREAATLQSASQIWRTKEDKHRKVFSYGLSALALIMIFSIGSLMYFWAEIIGAIPRKSDQDFAYGALVLIVAAVIAAAWIVRIFARWVTNSLTLGEDAEQRRALLETYFSLVGDPDAKMEQSDRILILNAIFRPLPGFQTEDVAPPTLLDLTKDALGGKKS
jgi:ABC-type multidrug transport system fused ATPase/permease subunit